MTDEMLICKSARIIVPDLLQEHLTGIISGLSGRAIVIRLDAILITGDSEKVSNAVISIRHANKSFIDIASGERVPCNITLVPDERFDPDRPCDLSWWRGGLAAIGEIQISAVSRP